MHFVGSSYISISLSSSHQQTGLTNDLINLKNWQSTPHEFCQMMKLGFISMDTLTVVTVTGLDTITF